MSSEARDVVRPVGNNDLRCQSNWSAGRVYGRASLNRPGGGGCASRADAGFAFHNTGRYRQVSQWPFSW